MAGSNMAVVKLSLLFAVLLSAAATAAMHRLEEGAAESAEGSAKLGDLSDVKYYLWTRSNPATRYNLLVFNSSSIEASYFDGTKSTYMIFHGFMAGGLFQWVLRAKDELLKKEDCNVISVDFRILVLPPMYPEAVNNTEMVANQTALFVDWLVTEYRLDLSKVHLAGHSIGAHCAGMVGGWLKTGTIARITGMDPAGPLYEEKDISERLTRDDAVFVDVIHTNSGDKMDGCVGMDTAIGDVDFYPNGGSHQPGCTGDYIDMITACSHSRSHDLWVESIATAGTDNTSFWSWPCPDYDSFASGLCTSCGGGCLQMGFPVNITGVWGALLYYLDTAPASPFALGGL